MRCRCLSVFAIIASLSLQAPSSAKSLAASSVLPVFSPYYQSDKKANEALRKQLEKQGYKALFFSKYQEFRSYLDSESSPAFVEMLSEGHYSDQNYSKQALEKEWVDFQVLGKKKVAKTELHKLILGAVQLAPRQLQQEQLERQLHSRIKALKTVSKNDDLITMLVLGNADLVLVDSRSVEALIQRYEVRIVIQDWGYRQRGEALIIAKAAKK